jgi:hypothetical protein
MFYIFFLVDVVECSRGDGEKEVGGWCWLNITKKKTFTLMY